MMARTYQIGFAVAEPEGLWAAGGPDLFTQVLEASWRPGATVTRYGRTWRLSRPHSQKHDSWTGRIGFIQEGDLTTVFWDPDAEDFRTQEASSGVVVPFAIRIPTGVVAFQLVSGVIRPTTFTGALQSLFNVSSSYPWRVTPLVVHSSFEEWKSRVPTITEFAFRVQVPNPRYINEPDVERLLEEVRLEAARVAGRARDGESINASADIFRQLLDHVRRDYGRGVVKGRDESGSDTEWDSSGGGTVPARRRIESEGEDEVLEGDLLRVLAEVESSSGDLDRGLPEEDGTS
jgi:hypothetical protein